MLSLGIGLAVGTVLIAKVGFELSYDKAFTDVENIYIIRTGYVMHGQESDYSQVSGAVAPGMKAEVPGVVEATRITGFFDSDRYMDDDGNVITGRMRFADSCFFRIFDRPVLAGDPSKALAKWGTAAVSRSFAERMGGVGECIGRQIYNEDLPQFRITVESVFEDFPANCSFGYDVLVSMESYSTASTKNWNGNDRYTGFVKLADGVDPSTLGPAIRKMQEAHQPLDELERNGTRLWYYLAPFGKAHTSLPEVRTTVTILSTTAALLIVISLLNYILIIVSSMVKRSREMGLRKCYGAGTADIYAMLIREALVDVGLSAALAAAIIFAGRGVVLNLLGAEFTTLLVPRSVAAVGCAVALILAVSILVPARLYLRVPVWAALKNYTDTSRRWKLGLLGVQVFINVFMAVVLGVISNQYRMVTNNDPGYDYSNLLYFGDYSYDRSDLSSRQRLVDALRQMPEVEAVAAAYRLPFYGANGDNILDDEGRELFNAADNYEVSAGFYDMLGIPFVEGREPQAADECAVDENFAAKIPEFFDWPDGVVGKQINITGHASPRFTVTGVYRTIRTGSLLAMDERPGVRFYGDISDGGCYMPVMLLRVTHIDADIVERVQQTVAEALDGKQTEVHSYAESMRSAYDDYRKMRNTMLVGAAFALFIALLGLVGFVRDETLRRTKEMAIRKINGATPGDILRLFMRDVMRLSAAMAAAGCVAAWYVAVRMLEMFAEKIPLSAGYFVAGAAAVLAVVAAVVVLGCRRIATENPVRLLKNE